MIFFCKTVAVSLSSFDPSYYMIFSLPSIHEAKFVELTFKTGNRFIKNTYPMSLALQSMRIVGGRLY